MSAAMSLIALSAASPSSPSAGRIEPAIESSPSRRSSSAISSDCCAALMSPGTLRACACLSDVSAAPL